MADCSAVMLVHPLADLTDSMKAAWSAVLQAAWWVAMMVVGTAVRSAVWMVAVLVDLSAVELADRKVGRTDTKMVDVKD